MFRQHSPRTVLASLLCLAVFGGTPGCQTQPAGKATAPVPAKATGEIEQCAGNLHDLCGYLLQYYVVNRKLPPQLQELAPFVDVDRTLPQTCPTSRQRYIYVANGLKSSSDPRWLLLYDPVPHEGVRNAIVGSEPAGDQPLGFWVIQLDQEAFSSFRPASPAQ